MTTCLWNMCSRIGYRPNPYSLQDPYDVTWFRQTNEQPVNTPLKSKTRNVVKVTLTTGEAAVIELTNDEAYIKPGSNTMTYRWKYRRAPSQPVQNISFARFARFARFAVPDS